jgi:hypothetical protein
MERSAPEILLTVAAATALLAGLTLAAAEITPPAVAGVGSVVAATLVLARSWLQWKRKKRIAGTRG